MSSGSVIVARFIFEYYHRLVRLADVQILERLVDARWGLDGAL